MNLPRLASRRAFLGGAAAVVTLPALASLGGGQARGAVRPKNPTAAVPSPRRLIVYHVPNGFFRPSFTPTGSGSSFTLSPTLAALKDLKPDILIPRGIANTAAVPIPGGGAHAVGCAALLTCRYPRKDRIHAGVSMDQIAARTLGKETRLASLQLAVDSDLGNDEVGWSAVYQRHISWGSATSPMPAILSPMRAFERMFRGFDPRLSRGDVQRRRDDRASVLDTVAASARGVSGQLGVRDREKVDEYLTSIREFEVRMGGSSQQTSGCRVSRRTLADAEAPIERRIDDFHALMRLAFMCDATRVITFQTGNGISHLSYPHLGFTDDSHGVTHHGEDQSKIEKVKTIDAWRVRKFAEFLRMLKRTKDSDGRSLLYNSVVLYMSEIGHGNGHDQHDKPMVIAGQLGGRIPTGQVLFTRPPDAGDQYVACDEKTRTPQTPLPPGCSDSAQLSELYMTLLGHMGVHVDTFGDFGRTPLSLQA